MGFPEARSLFLSLLLVHSGSDQGIDLLGVDVVESHIHVTDKMVSLLAG